MAGTTEETVDRTAQSWSQPYYGIMHYGALQDHRRATIRTITDDEFELVHWIRGVSSPTVTPFSDLQAAKTAGEEWANSI